MSTLLPHKFGPYGGQFVPETLMFALDQLDRCDTFLRRLVRSLNG